MGFLIFIDSKGKGFEASYYQTFFRHVPVSFLPCTACWTRICPIAWQHVEKLPFHILNECRPKYKNITYCDRHRHKLSIKKWPQMTLVKDSPSSVQIFWRANFHLVNQMGGGISSCLPDRQILINKLTTRTYVSSYSKFYFWSISALQLQTTFLKLSGLWSGFFFRNFEPDR